MLKTSCIAIPIIAFTTMILIFTLMYINVDSKRDRDEGRMEKLFTIIFILLVIISFVTFIIGCIAYRQHCTRSELTSWSIINNDFPKKQPVHSPTSSAHIDFQSLDGVTEGFSTLGNLTERVHSQRLETEGNFLSTRYRGAKLEVPLDMLSLRRQRELNSEEDERRKVNETC